MADRPFIFRDGGTELVLPVTPDKFVVEKGINVELVNIHELGDIVLAGYGTLATIKISSLLPAHNYNFTLDDDPGPYISQFEKWVEERKNIRFIVGGADVNLSVIVQNFSYGEQDGTNDIYAEITMREYRAPAVVKISTTAGASKSRSDPESKSAPGAQSYKIVYGDTLSAICRKYYGDGSAATYNKLAAYNGISNPHLILAGNTLKIPQPLV